MSRLGFGKNNFSKVVPCTVELLNSAIDSAEVMNVCGQIARKLEAVKAGQATRTEFDDYKTAMKKHLPVLTPHAIFKNGERKNAEAIPSGLSMYDIDHIENPRGYYHTMIEDRISELGINMAHVTPSTEGLRLIFEMPAGMTLAQAQKWMSEQLGDENYDGSVKDYARCSYLVPRAYILYLDEEELLKEREVKAEAVKTGAQTPNEAMPSATATVLLPSPAILQDSPEHQRNLRIFDLAMKEAGLKPDDIDVVGVHNWHISLVAILTVGISRLMSQQAMMDVLATRMPNYSKEADCQRLVADFYDKYTKVNAPMPMSLRTLFKQAQQEQSAPKKLTSQQLGCLPPAMPEKMPKLIKLLCSKEPEHLHPAIALSAFPALGSHLYDVHFLYADNTYHEATFMHHTMAKTASGKSCVSRVCDCIMRDILERDEINRQREQDYKDECAKKGTNQQAPDRPDDLIVQTLLTDITPAALAQKGKDADGHFIYSQLDEIELFDQLDASKQKRRLRNIIQCAFDNAWYGQERVGEKSVTARFRLHYNFNSSSTIVRAQDFYAPFLADGSFNRMSFATIMPIDDEAIPKHGFYDARFMARLKVYIDRLVAAQGNYDLKKAQDLIQRIHQESIDTYRLSGDEAYFDTSHRAVVLAWLRAMVLYIAEGKWSKEIEEFAMWSFKYDMWVKMTYYGDSIRKQMAGEKVSSHRGPGNRLQYLPDEFTFDDAQRLLERLGSENTNPRKMLWTGETRKFIEQDPLTGIYHKTAYYFEVYPKPVA
ncbi:BT4734/BF3469 family protein [Prevotella sp. P6B1]|uniref:BT4734/BF3469 family protein n=1 Tax=Prevotella sp. P6B1 TaxID=1410613 RepID=UPI000689D414|nr:BT4734/BF3469 family protein [Prevotella sp. P6B1]